MANEKEEAKKVKRPTAKKRDIQSKKRNLQNKAYKATLSTAIRALEDVMSKGDSANAKEKLSKVFSLVDKGVKKGKVKLNKASRVKAGLTKRAEALKA